MSQLSFPSMVWQDLASIIAAERLHAVGLFIRSW